VYSHPKPFQTLTYQLFASTPTPARGSHPGKKKKKPPHRDHRADDAPREQYRHRCGHSETGLLGERTKQRLVERPHLNVPLR